MILLSIFNHGHPSITFDIALVLLLNSTQSFHTKQLAGIRMFCEHREKLFKRTQREAFQDPTNND